MSKSPKADNLPLPPLPDQKFKVISLDPPWHFRSRAQSKNPDSVRSPQKHYPTMDLEHLEKLPIKQLAEPDCFVFLWITGPLMAIGVHNRLFRAWGVRPSSTAFVWIKTWNSFDIDELHRTPLLENDVAMGTGFTTRQNAEFVMLGRIGSPKRARADIRQVIISNRMEHSRKPAEYYRRVEHYTHGPRLDMFAGAEREGWTSFGWSHRDGEREEVAAPVRKGVWAKCLSCGVAGPINKQGSCEACAPNGCPVSSKNPNEICDACNCWKASAS